MAKWAARFALGLSNSVPGVRIRPEDIFVLKDEGTAVLLNHAMKLYDECSPISSVQSLRLGRELEKYLPSYV